MIGIDTNVIARHLLGDDAVQSSTASEFLHTLTPERPGFITHVTLVELDWLLRSGYGIPRESRLTAIRRLVETSAIEFEDGESVVRALTLAEEGADFADALIAASAELFGVRDVVTFDRSAARRLGWTALAS